MVTGILSVIAGPFIGLIGSATSSYFKLKEAKLRIEEKSLDHAHELKLADLQAKVRGQEMELESDLANLKADIDALTASYGHDAAISAAPTYNWVAAVQSLTRPVLTIVAAAGAAGAFYVVQSDLPADAKIDLCLKIMMLPEIAFTWWFADRSKAKRLG